MKLGKAAMEALQAEITGCLKPGDELIVAGAAALEGTARIVYLKKDELKRYFSPGFLTSCISLKEDYGTENGSESETGKNHVWDAAVKAGASCLYAMGEGGFLSALWKMAEASQVGLETDLRKVPIRQETIEICEIYDLNPYKLMSDGAILIGIRGGEGLVQELRRMGYMAEIIGQTNAGNDRLLYSNGNPRYLERPAKDELWRVEITGENHG